MTEDESFDYLVERATNEGISYDKLMNMIPDSISDDLNKSAEFCQLRDYSHILAESTHPELASDPTNAFFEHASTNRARGAEAVSDCERSHGEIDNEKLAHHIDTNTVDDYSYEPIDPVDHLTCEGPGFPSGIPSPLDFLFV